METRTALVVGGTGLIGRHLLEGLLINQNYHKVTALTRKSLEIQHDKFEEIIIDFDNLSNIEIDQSFDDAFCCLGTTMKKAGSKDAFYKVDFTYVINFALLALKSNVKGFQVVSALGASSTSFIYYNKVKGMMEKELSNLNFSTLNIFQPSLLLGERNENRLGEGFGKTFNTLFSFMIPKKYKGIEGEKVAKFMINTTLIKNNKGIHFFTSDKMQ